jgi:adhesin transport system membrane fusion protein
VRSPVNGIVQKLFVNTVGGVIKPGEDLVEIVPTSEKLYLEVKIKPTDIAFIHPGAEAKVKFTAYDYAIYGGLVGKVVNISPDSITDEKDNTYYQIKIETEKNYLGTKEHPLRIIPGMVVDVNIVTGKKTVMEYILKPILKSKQYVFTER